MPSKLRTNRLRLTVRVARSLQRASRLMACLEHGVGVACEANDRTLRWTENTLEWQRWVETTGCSRSRDKSTRYAAARVQPWNYQRQTTEVTDWLTDRLMLSIRLSDAKQLDVVSVASKWNQHCEGQGELEVRRAEAAWDSWGGRGKPPTHQLKWSGERCNLSQWSPGHSHGRQEFFWCMLGSLGKLYTAVLLCKADELGILLRGEKKLLPRGVGIAEASVVYRVNTSWGWHTPTSSV